MSHKSSKDIYSAGPPNAPLEWTGLPKLLICVGAIGLPLRGSVRRVVQWSDWISYSLGIGNVSLAN